MDTIDHRTLSRLVEAGAVRGAHVIGQRGGWALIIRYGMQERPLAAQRSGQVRLFKKLDTVAAYLHGIGLARFDVDAANYEPDALAGRRPDRAEALRRTFAAAAAHEAQHKPA
jgi:hypothetical protein